MARVLALKPGCSRPSPPFVPGIGAHAVEPHLALVGGIDGNAGVVPPAVAALVVNALRIAETSLEQDAPLQLPERVCRFPARVADGGELHCPRPAENH